MKILFVNTSKRHVLPHFNLGMNSIMAYLLNKGVKFDYLDLNIELFDIKKAEKYYHLNLFKLLYQNNYCKYYPNQITKQNVKDLINKKKLSLSYDLIFCDLHYTSYSNDSLNSIKIIKSLMPSAKIIVGGMHAIVLADEIIKKPYIDYVIKGFPEETIWRIIKTRFDLNQVHNITYKKKGKICETKLDSKQIIRSIPSQIKLLESNMINIAKYLKYAKLIFGPKFNERNPLGEYFLTYGCSGNCIFCASKKIDLNSIIFKRFEDFKKELDWLKRKYNLMYLTILDSNFLNNEQPRIKKFCRIIKNFNIKYTIQTKIKGLNEPIIKDLKSSGCRVILLGVETLNLEVYNRINKTKKPFDLRKILKINYLCRKYHIYNTNTFIIGLPGETTKSLDFQLNLHKKYFFNYSIFYLPIKYPGTVLSMLDKKKIDWDDFIIEIKDKLDINKPIYYIDKNLSEEILKDYYVKFNKTIRRNLLIDLIYFFKILPQVSSYYDLKYLFITIISRISDVA